MVDTSVAGRHLFTRFAGLWFKIQIQKQHKKTQKQKYIKSAFVLRFALH